MASKTDSYSGVYDTRIGYGAKPALILIDFVQAYFDPDCDLFADPQEALESALRIRQAAHAATVPVVHTCVVYHPSFIDGGRFFQKAAPLRHFYEGSPMGAWPKGLNPEPDELVLKKQYPSAFFGTSLASTLTARGIDSVILTGLTTSGCVRATCVDACSHGFIPIVVEEACSDRHASPHEANMFDMNAKYADVVREKDILVYLERLKAAHESKNA